MTKTDLRNIGDMTFAEVCTMIEADPIDVLVKHMDCDACPLHLNECLVMNEDNCYELLNEL